VHSLQALDKSVRGSGLAASLIDLVKIRVSQLNGCIFCVDMHIKEARLHGEREIRLHHLAAWHESTLFSDQERAALEWAEQLTRIGHGGISDADYQRIAAHYSEKEISDLTFAVGSINFWNRIGVAFRPEPGSMDALLGLDKALLN
jgi:AhpD family alkylhydroperoxidase